MARAKGLRIAALATTLSLTTAALADEIGPPPTLEADERPLMGHLRQSDIGQTLDAWRLDIYGHVQGSYNYNFRRPDDGINVHRVFDFEHDKVRLNQWNLTVERTIDATQGEWDLGGRMEWIYGADAGLIHSHGLFDWYDDPRSPQNQLDLNQAYLEVGIPVGNGLGLKLGKFVTLLGAETIDPTQNIFFSHSHMFGFAIPFTHTGILASYPLSDAVTINAGITRGWEQSLQDNNDSCDFLGSIEWQINDQLSLAIANTFGPQQDDNTSNMRNVINVVVNYQATDELLLALDSVYGYEEDVPGIGFSDWYGIAGYASYKLSRSLALNGRLEWFDDRDGSRGLGTTVYGATVGLGIRPFVNHRLGQHVIIRPELRFDWAQDPTFDVGTRRSQVTAAVDLILMY